MSEIEALKTVFDALETLEKDEQARVLTWAWSKYCPATPSPAAASLSAPAVTKAHEPKGAAAASQKLTPAKAKGGKKSKTIISMDKSLNLNPAGKDSAVDFAAAKLPTSVKEKCVVAVYYLRDVIAQEQVSAQGVFTFFKAVQWPVPTDLKNTLQQAGSEGWLDTSDSDDIKLTSIGENLVEHKLPKKPKA